MASVAECLSPTFPWRRAWSCLMVWQLMSLGCCRGVHGTAGGSSGAVPDFCIIVALKHACITCTSTHVFTHVYTHTYAHTHICVYTSYIFHSTVQYVSDWVIWQMLKWTLSYITPTPWNTFPKDQIFSLSFFCQISSQNSLFSSIALFSCVHSRARAHARVCVCVMTKCVCGTFVFCISCKCW